MPSRIACSCPDWRFHGSNMTRERLESKAALAGNVAVEKDQGDGEFVAWSQDDDRHYINLEPSGELDRLCKHCIAVLWHENMLLYLVEYAGPTCEVRAEAFWGDELAVRAIMNDGEVLAITKLERRIDEG